MNLKVCFLSERGFNRMWIGILLAAAVAGCKPEGFINKVKYRGEKYVNTCESFSADINKIIQANNQPTVLKVSEYDNSDFTYYYLEPGQFEIKDDTVMFRLAQDLEYAQYLDKGVAVHVNASYKAVENIQDLESDAAGDLGVLIIDRAYYLANRKPFFLYKFPLGGKTIAGKQLMLSFAIAKYDKKGRLRNFFCETNSQPIGTAMPACCTALPWENTSLQSVVDFPEIEVADESFRYTGFTGTIDVQFEESSYDLEDDSAFSLILVQSYIEKYKALGYKINRIDITGWASPGGKIKLNEDLSQKRADALKEGLQVLNGELDGLEITAKGMGEDWERVKILTRQSSLNQDQQDQVLAIANDASLSNDQKEAKLRKVPFWDPPLVEEVLIKARHTFCVMDFEYTGDVPTLNRFSDRLPVASDELEKVANTEISVSEYEEGVDIAQNMNTINELLTQKASPNLYAMRATYYLAQDEYAKAIEDLERAASFRGERSKSYELAVQGYKVLFADTYSFAEKKKMYEDFTRLAGSNPSDRALLFNRAILMDKIGFLSGALGEYQSLMGSVAPSASNLNNRGVARLKANMFTHAAQDFQNAVSQQQDLAAAYYNLAAVHAYRGLTKKTIEFLDQAIQRNPFYKEYIFNNPVFSVMSEDPRFDKYR